MKASYSLSLPPGHVSFECEMAFEIEQIIVQPIKILLFVSNF